MYRERESSAFSKHSSTDSLRAESRMSEATLGLMETSVSLKGKASANLDQSDLAFSCAFSRPREHQEEGW